MIPSVFEAERQRRIARRRRIGRAMFAALVTSFLVSVAAGLGWAVVVMSGPFRWVVLAVLVFFGWFYVALSLMTTGEPDYDKKGSTRHRSYHDGGPG